jgi:cell division inhibitor SulA
MKQLSMYDSEIHEAQRIELALALEAQEIKTTKRQPIQKSDASIQANVTEIIIAKDKADSVQMVLPMLTRLNQEQRWLAWIDPPMELLKKWQTHTDAKGDDIMLLRSSKQNDAIRLAERALRAGTCHAVIVWTNGLDSQSFERLESASAEGDSHGIVLRLR